MGCSRETRRWAPFIPAYAAAALLFFSFARPNAWMIAGSRVSLAEGSLQVTWPGSAGRVPLLGHTPVIGSLFAPRPRQFTNWWFAFEFRGPSPGFAIPLWAPVLVLGLAGAALRRRSRSHGCCPACGYDLAGLAAMPGTGVCCPECGACEAAGTQPQ